MNLLTVINIIVIAVFLPLNIVVLVREIKTALMRRRFNKFFSGLIEDRRMGLRDCYNPNCEMCGPNHE